LKNVLNLRQIALKNNIKEFVSCFIAIKAIEFAYIFAHESVLALKV
jgi:hypothetical protein